MNDGDIERWHGLLQEKRGASPSRRPLRCQWGEDGDECTPMTHFFWVTAAPAVNTVNGKKKKNAPLHIRISSSPTHWEEEMEGAVISETIEENNRFQLDLFNRTLL